MKFIKGLLHIKYKGKRLKEDRLKERKQNRRISDRKALMDLVSLTRGSEEERDGSRK